MRSRGCHVHLVTAHRLILKSVVEQMQHLVDTFALDCHKILNRVDIILVPLEFKAFLSTHQLVAHLACLLRFKHLLVQQVVNLLVIELHEGDIDRYSTVSAQLGQILEKLASASLHKADLVGYHGFLDLGHVVALPILHVLVALHSIRFSCTSLPVCENCCMVAVADMTNHGFNSSLEVEGPLVGLPVAHHVELVVFVLFIARIKPQIYAVSLSV